MKKISILIKYFVVVFFITLFLTQSVLAEVGVDWTVLPAGVDTGIKFGTTNINSVAYGNGKFVAVGDFGKASYSTDGINWNVLTAGVNSGIKFDNIGYIARSVAYGNGKFVVVGDNGMCSYSTDGVTWTALPSGSATTGLKFGTSIANSVAYGNGRFVAVGNNGKASYSTNGINWNILTAGNLDGIKFGTTGQAAYSVTYGGDKFVVVGVSGKASYSTDGVTWTALPAGTDTGIKFGTGTALSVTYGNGRFVAVGHGGKASYSANGIDWTTLVAGDGTGIKFGTVDSGYSVAYGGDKFVVVGAYGKASYSTDGVTWTALTAGADTGIKFGTVHNGYSVAYGGDKFVVVGSAGIASYSLNPDTIPPVVTSVTSSVANSTYGLTQVIPIQIHFDEVVNVTGTPQLEIVTGNPSTTVINYSSGSGSTTLTFNYTVASGNSSVDLDYVSVDALTLNGGTIKDDALNDANLALATPGEINSLGFNKDIVILTITTPTITSSSATSITATGATFNGEITATGGENATDRGFEYGTTTSYGTTASTTGSYSTGTFTADITDLLPFTTYHYRAFAVNSVGTSTSSDQTFTTLANLPTVTASAVTAISTTDALLTGNITSTGGENATDRGFEYGLTTTYGTIASSTGSYGTGEYTASLTGLTPNTTYHYRAFAVNSAGTGTSTDQEFTTDPNQTSSGSRSTSRSRITVTPPVTTPNPLPLTTPGNSLPSATSPQFTNTLTRGTESSEVLALQNRLSTLGFLTATPNGYFGPATEAAVKAFQTANNLPPVGIVGPLTRALLNETPVTPINHSSTFTPRQLVDLFIAIGVIAPDLAERAREVVGN